MREAIQLSIVIPAYELGGWEEDCLGSLEAQICREGWESVVVDDGSTDGTGESVDAWVRRAPWLRVIHQPNAGVNPARRRGILATRGDFVWCVDGDDVLHPQAVAVVMEACRQALGVELWVVGEVVGQGPTGKVRFAPLVQTEGAITEKRCCDLSTLMICFCIFTRNLGLAIHPDNLMVGEDILFAQRMLVCARKVGKIDLPLYGYQMRESSVTHTPSVRRLYHSIAFHRRYIPFLHEHCDKLNARSIRQSKTAFFFRLPRDILCYRGTDRKGLILAWFTAVRQVGHCGGRVWIWPSWCAWAMAWCGATRLALMYVNAWIFRYGSWRARQRRFAQGGL